jgi:hypothetical protein
MHASASRFRRSQRHLECITHELETVIHGRCEFLLAADVPLRGLYRDDKIYFKPFSQSNTVTCSAMR